MAKPKKSDKDRRAVVEQLRLEQKQKERRRTSLVIAVCVLVALVIVGLGALPLLRQGKAAAGDLRSLGVPANAAGCRAVLTRNANGNSDHKPVGTAIYYPQSPPAFGPHWPTPAAFSRKFYSAADRPELEYLVHNLEHGYTLLWYDQTVADDPGELATVKGIADTFVSSSLDGRDKFIAVPWTSKDGEKFPSGTHLALTHWSMGGTHGSPKTQQGIWQYCEKPSGSAVGTFMANYPYTDSPEPGAL